MAVRVEYSRQATRTLLAIDRPTARRIRSKVVQLASDPASLANTVRALRGQGEGLMRLRVGDWRVIYRIDDSANRVLVLSIANRREVYE